MRFVAALSVAAVFVGCATKVASTTAGEISAIDPSQNARALSAIDGARLCLDVQIFAATALTDDQLRDYVCAEPVLFGGAVATFGGDRCRQLVDECPALSQGRKLREPIDYGACGEFASDLETCDITVGELEACLDDLAFFMLNVSQQKNAMCEPGYAGLRFDRRFYEPWLRCEKCAYVLSYAERVMTGGPAVQQSAPAP